MKFKQQLTFENVVAGKKAFCNIPLGNRLLAVILEIGSGADLTYDNILDDIYLKVNDNVQRTMTALELNELNAANGAQYAARVVNVAAVGADRTYLPIYFYKPWAKLARDQEGSAWTTDWMNSLRLEAVIKAGVANPVLNAFYVFDNVTNGGKPQYIEKWIRTDLPAVGSRNSHPSAIERKDIITQISIWDPAAASSISRVKIKGGGVELVDLYRQQIGADLQHYAEMTAGMAAEPATAGRLDIAFDGDGLLESGLPAASYPSLVLDLEYLAAANGSCRAIIQRFGLAE